MSQGPVNLTESEVKQQRHVLLEVYLLMQLQIWVIDELEGTNFYVKKVKQLSNLLREAIMNDHGKQLKSIYGVENGEMANEMLKIMDHGIKMLSRADMKVWDVLVQTLQEASDPEMKVIEPHEANQVIIDLRRELEETKDQLAKMQFMFEHASIALNGE